MTHCDTHNRSNYSIGMCNLLKAQPLSECLLPSRMQEERERLAELQGPPKIDPHVAATSIQKVWKGYWQRKQTAKLKAEELVLLGMEPPPAPKSQKSTSVYLARKVEVCCAHDLG